MDHDYLKRSSDQIDEQESEYTQQRYPSSQVYKGLGLTRDALRYYEELGILSPAKNEENNYREYSMRDIMNILAIDFYKKRGVTPKELKQVKEQGKQEDYKRLFIDKKATLTENIKYHKRMLRKLEETIAFLEAMETEVNQLKIKEFPLYEIDEEISSLANFKEYGEKVLKHIDISEEDIYSNMVKALMIDDKGYTGTKAYFVKRAKRETKGREYLEQGEALYAVLDDPEHGEENLMEVMYVKCTEWGKEHQRKFKGVVYLMPRCIIWSGNVMANYLECWVLLEK